MIRNWIIRNIAKFLGYDVFLYNQNQLVKQIEDECLWSSKSAEDAISILQNKGVLAFIEEIYSIPE